MAAKKSKILIHLNLLKSQTDSSKLTVKIFRWLLVSGKYIFISVEMIVLIAFFIRFRLDINLQSKKKEIDQKKDYIESLRSSEIAIKQTQFKLTTIGKFYSNYGDNTQILKELADQTPPGVKFVTLSLENQQDKIAIKLSAQAQSSNDIALFLAELKSNKNFKEVTLTTIGLEQNIIKFTINLSAPLNLES